jgi:hypothetical protein
MWSKRIAYLMPWVKHVTLQLHTNWLHESHPLIKQIFIQPLNFALARVRDLFCSLTVDRTLNCVIESQIQFFTKKQNPKFNGSFLE